MNKPADTAPVLNTIRITGLPPGRYTIELADSGAVTECTALRQAVDHVDSNTPLKRFITKDVLLGLGVEVGRINSLLRNLCGLFASNEAYDSCTVGAFTQCFTQRDLKHNAHFRPEEVKLVAQLFYHSGHVLHEISLPENQTTL